MPIGPKCPFSQMSICPNPPISPMSSQINTYLPQLPICPQCPLASKLIGPKVPICPKMPICPSPHMLSMPFVQIRLPFDPNTHLPKGFICPNCPFALVLIFSGAHFPPTPICPNVHRSQMKIYLNCRFVLMLIFPSAHLPHMPIFPNAHLTKCSSFRKCPFGPKCSFAANSLPVCPGTNFSWCSISASAHLPPIPTCPKAHRSQSAHLPQNAHFPKCSYVPILTCPFVPNTSHLLKVLICPKCPRVHDDLTRRRFDTRTTTFPTPPPPPPPTPTADLITHVLRQIVFASNCLRIKSAA